MKHLRILTFSRDLTASWSKILPLVQRILNYTKDGSIDMSPAQIIFGNMLPVDVSVIMPATDGFIPVSDYLRSLQESQLNLIKLSQQHLESCTSKRDSRVDITKASDYGVGDYVLLSYPSRPPNKLAGLYRGPLVVHRKLRGDIYEVLDLITDRIYQVHVSRMHALSLPSSVDRDDLLRIAGLDHHEFIVEAIIDHRGDGRNKKDLEFLVRWQGFEPGDDTWESYTTLKDVAALDIYSCAHPELGLG